ncbi:probable CCR4-associated factor 1 homolog 9 [Chenopodium quinoa]|uniref:poly(A)-specific ribonuclease n=1 Tax=Chenopodium quinoa TaxID=63459 RepID=A0A803L326_CHEQI|nr:probable CCR4-associated factor 1 homolog 9 [Chenopodium quinoa]
MAIVQLIKIREVWSDNLESEFLLIRSLIDDYSYVAMDTEFPGVLFRQFGSESRPKYTSPGKHYSLLKQNVDALKIIQLGLTLVDSNGNLPNLGNPKIGYIWQFNFKDFDVTTDNQSPDSVELLRNHGIDFAMNLKSGVDSVKFAELMMSSGLVCNDNSVTWLTFHCAYDFGYLVKVLTQSELPSELSVFVKLVRIFFGGRVFDVKYMIRFCDGLYGGLDRVAKALEVKRMVGQSHQAGSDSLLTWVVFEKIREIFFKKPGSIDNYAGMLYGLETS